jgi:hypothetical protein
MDALFESPINIIPSGPKARAFTDLISGEPTTNPFLSSANLVELAASTITTRASVEK